MNGRVVNVHGPDDVRLDPIMPIMVGDNDILVDIAACGVCGTDLAFIRRGGMRPGQSGIMPLGHEAAGRVSAVGSAVNNIAVGQRVLINPMGSTSVIGNGGTEGAFTEQLLVRDAAPGHSVLPIPSNMPYEIAALAEPLAVALHTVNRVDPKPHEKIVVFGAGPIGLGVVIWLKRRGVASIIVIDLAEERLERARALGATDTIRGDDPALVDKIKAIHGTATLFGMPASGTDAYIDVAGAPSIVPTIVSIAKFHARLVVTATQKGPVMLDLGMMLMSEMTITTSVGYPTELPEVLETLATIKEDAASLISHRFAFDDVLDAFVTAGTPASAKVMVYFEGSAA